MAEADLHVEKRSLTDHQTAKTLRRHGQVPAIFYYHNEDSIPLILNGREMERLTHQEVNIINVVFPDGKSRKSILREVQRDPVSGAILHVDLMGIKLTEKVRLTIPVILKGTPVGVKDQGGILEHLLREVSVEGLPLDIPEHIEIDVSDLNIGDVVTLEEIPTEKFRFVTEVQHAVANVIHPKVVEEEEVVEEELEEGEEPEEGEGKAEEQAPAEDA